MVMPAAIIAWPRSPRDRRGATSRCRSVKYR